MTTVNIKRLDSVTANDTAATKNINDNFKAVKEALEKSVSRVADVPNYMDTDLDMNSRRIINTGAPVNGGDLVNLDYFNERVGDAKVFADAAKASADRAEYAEANANIAAGNAHSAVAETQKYAEDAKTSAKKAEDFVSDAQVSAALYRYRPYLKKDTVVEPSQFVKDNIDADYPYMAKISVVSLPSETAYTYKLEASGYVSFNNADALSGIFSPSCEFVIDKLDYIYDGYCIIRAKELPKENVNIPTIAFFLGD